MKNLTSHTVVKNGEKFIEQVLVSLVGNVDKIMIVDTGSTDKTIKIINAFINTFRSIVEVNFRQEKVEGDWQKGIPEMTIIRNRMLKETKTEWAVIIDDDEIWPVELFNEFQKRLKILKALEKDVLAFTAPFYDFVDMKNIVAGPIQSPANRIVRVKKVRFVGDWPNERWEVIGEEGKWLNKFKDLRVWHLKTPYFHYGRMKKKEKFVRPEEKGLKTYPYYGEHPMIIKNENS